jgi:hypothetical protein
VCSVVQLVRTKVITLMIINYSYHMLLTNNIFMMIHCVSVSKTLLIVISVEVTDCDTKSQDLIKMSFDGKGWCSTFDMIN